MTSPLDGMLDVGRINGPQPAQAILGLAGRDGGSPGGGELIRLRFDRNDSFDLHGDLVRQHDVADR